MNILRKITAWLIILHIMPFLCCLITYARPLDQKPVFVDSVPLDGYLVGWVSNIGALILFGVIMAADWSFKVVGRR